MEVRGGADEVAIVKEYSRVDNCAAMKMSVATRVTHQTDRCNGARRTVTAWGGPSPCHTRGDDISAEEG